MKHVFVIVSSYDGVQRLAVRRTRLAARRLMCRWAAGPTALVRESPDCMANDFGWRIEVHEAVLP